MKRDRFQTKVLNRCSTWAQWVERVWKRRGEAPYELMTVWRRAFGVPASMPYANARLVIREGVSDGMAFSLEDDDNSVYMFARVEYETGLPTIELYDAAERVLDYDDWRDKAAWPWTNERRRDFSTLPTDVWEHFARALISKKGGCFRCAHLGLMPLSKGWRETWARPRMRKLVYDKIPKRFANDPDPLRTLMSRIDFILSSKQKEVLWRKRNTALWLLNILHEKLFPGEGKDITTDQHTRAIRIGIQGQAIKWIVGGGMLDVISLPGRPRYLRTHKDVFDILVEEDE